MRFDPKYDGLICRQVLTQSIDRIRSERQLRRAEALTHQEVLSIEHVQLCELNQLLAAAVQRVRPLSQMMGVPVWVLNQPNLPSVPCVKSALQVTIDAAIDYCLDTTEPMTLWIRTLRVGQVVLCMIERRVIGSVQQGRWVDRALEGNLDLIYGESVCQMVHGRLRLLSRNQNLRIQMQLKLPSMSGTLGFDHMPALQAALQAMTNANTGVDHGVHGIGNDDV